MVAKQADTGDRLDRALARVAALAHPRLLLPLVGLNFFAAAVLIGYVMPSGHSDDAEIMLLSQSFAWGYEPKNPPLFAWVNWALAGLFGPAAEWVYGQRMFWLAVMIGATILLARALQPDPWVAAAAGLAPLATIHFFWYALFDFTHSTAAGAFYPLTLLALMQVARRPGTGRYLLLGVVVGLGMLTKYVYLLFLVALIVATAANPRLRAVLQDPRLGLAVAAAVVIDLPHGLWLLDHLSMIDAQAARSVELAAPGEFWPGVGQGLGALLGSVISVLVFPFAVLYASLFLGRNAPPGPGPGEREAFLRLLRDLFIALALVFLGVVLAGATRIAPHHLFFLALVPVWLVARLNGTRRWAAPAFLATVAGWTVLAFVLYLPANLKDARTCTDCREFLPLRAYAETVRAAGFGGGTLVTLSRRQHFPGAMLREHLPEARVVSPHYPTYQPPRGADPGDCLVVWSAARDQALGERLRGGHPVPLIGRPLPPETRFGTAVGRLHLADREAPAMAYALVPGGLGECR